MWEITLRGVAELYGLYLCHANSQMHMYLNASSIKIFTKHNVFAMYWLNQGGWFHVEIYMCGLGLWFANTIAAKIIIKHM